MSSAPWRPLRLRMMSVRARLESVTRDLLVVCGVGVVGSVLLAVASWWVGALRRSRPAAIIRFAGSVREVVPPVRAEGAYVVFWVGLGLLSLAWLLLARVILGRPQGAGGDAAIRRIGLLWAAPLLAAAPVGSRDLWAYAAQANLAAHGVNPYSSGPGSVAGSFSEQVSVQWLHAPSPYGPVWLSVTSAARVVLGAHPSLVALAARLAAVAGLLILAWSVPILARRFSGRPGLAAWAVVANPYVLIDGVAGGHNDLLMAGLASAAVVAATSDLALTAAMAVAGVLVGLATGVKLPALLLVAFLPMLWVRQRGRAPRWRTQLTAAALAAASAALVLIVFSVSTGFGLGWWQTASGARHSAGALTAVMAVVVVAVAWERSRVWEPLAMLAAAVAALLLAIPSASWWYWILPLALAAPLLRARSTIVATAAVSLSLLALVRPDGNALHLRVELLLSVGLLAATVAIDPRSPARWRTSAGRSVPDPSQTSENEPPPSTRRRVTDSRVPEDRTDGASSDSQLSG